jgi:AmmeMemoRadiSam system protein A
MTGPAPRTPRLSAGDRAALLALARAAVVHRLGLGPAPAPPAAGPLAAPGAAVVTLRVAGEPRGALGELAPSGPLGEAVARLAARAAAEDPRVPPLGEEDLPALRVAVAALGPLRPLPGPEALRLGAEGVAVTQGWHRGLLLPSAAAGKGWDAPLFLKHACLAAGLPARAHLDPDAVVEAFEAEEFEA